MQVTFFDSTESWTKLLPLTYTRPSADLRVGILKIHEKWQLRLGITASFFRTERYLSTLFGAPTTKSLYIKGNLLPNDALVSQVLSLKANEVLVYNDQILAGFFDADEPLATGDRVVVSVPEAFMIEYTWHIFKRNGAEIRADYALLTKGRHSAGISDPHTITYGDDIFVEEGANIKAAVLNAENGPIYIGKGASISEGTLIKGPHALLDGSVINMGAKIRGDSTIGPYSKVGGEFSNSVIQGYSSKGHDGFLGNSVIGEWCNLGADTNNSNLKNNYADVKMWEYATGRFRDTGLQFCGLIMGDHSKCGINTMLNTGTTVGVSANIFGAGFPRNFVPSFAWGGASGFSTYQTKRAFDTAELVMERREKQLTEADKGVLQHIFDQTAHYRVWEAK